MFKINTFVRIYATSNIRNKETFNKLDRKMLTSQNNRTIATSDIAAHREWTTLQLNCYRTKFNLLP